MKPHQILRKHHDLYGSRPKTLEQAKAYVQRYEAANRDLEPPVRRLLALFALGTKKTAIDIVDTLLGYPSTVPYRDISRRWWLVLESCRLEEYWEGFKERGQEQNVLVAWRWLRELARERHGPEMVHLLYQRLGPYPHGPPQNYGERSPFLWYKAGSWAREKPLTRLLILGKPLKYRDPCYHRWVQQLGGARLRLLERELVHLIDPDVITPPEAAWRAKDYVERRLGELLAGRKKVSAGMIAWVLGTAVPGPTSRTMVTSVLRRGREFVHVDDGPRRPSSRRRIWA